jgi:hypothetical protein
MLGIVAKNPGRRDRPLNFGQLDGFVNPVDCVVHRHLNNWGTIPLLPAPPLPRLPMWYRILSIACLPEGEIGRIPAASAE